MENNEEYHDPDYPEVSINVKEEAPVISEEDKIEKIKQIIRREFRSELNVRENEVTLIDQRMTVARRYLHQVRYALVNNYYKDQKLQLTGSQIEDEVAAQSEPRARTEVSSILRDSQRRLHPSVRKLLGKQTADLEEIFRSREPRNKFRRDYSAMVQSKNITISADSTISLRPGPEKTEEEEPSSSKPKKIPRHIDPKVNNVVTVDEITRNKKKHRYRIIIGNTSKYAPPASRLDRSTHKWLLYVRGPPACPDLSRVLSAVSVQLHHSYAPHHTVHIDKPPFQVSRRGWGEFPARVTLHFALPDRNRPATVTHTLKLDRHYTGLQTLGAETVADVWLYSTPEMLKFEYKADEEQIIYPPKPLEEIKQESHEEPSSNISDTKDNQNDSWLDFFSKDTTEVNVDEMFVKNIKKEPEDVPSEEVNGTEQLLEENVVDNNHITNGVDKPEVILDNSLDMKKEIPAEVINKPKKRIMKYMDPTTRKIYYLEMDRALDLTKVQEIVINSQGDVQTAKISPIKSNGLKQVRHKKPVSLLKPEVKNQLKKNNNSEKILVKNDFSHIQNDHCYLGTNWYNPDRLIKEEAKSGNLCDNLEMVITKFTCVRVIVSYLLKKIPLISVDARDPDFVQCLPFVVDNDEKYWKLDFAKRRNMEWSRAKLINKMLTERFKTDQSKVWRTKQILVFSRLHGYYPVRPDNIHKGPEMDTNEWSSWNDLENTRQLESNIRKLYPNSSDICSLTLFNSDYYVPKNSTDNIDLCESDEEIDIVNEELPVKVKKIKTETESLNVLPVDKEDKLRFFYIEKICSDIGIELRNEDIGSGYSYSAVHSVLLSAVKCFAEELLRSSLADQLSLSNDPQLPTVWTGSSSRTRVRLEHVFRAATSNPRMRVVTARALGAERKHAHAI